MVSMPYDAKTQYLINIEVMKLIIKHILLFYHFIFISKILKVTCMYHMACVLIVYVTLIYSIFITVPD